MHEHIEKPNVQAFFSSDVRNMDDWAQRTGIPLTTAEALGATYARAHGWLLSLRSQLVQHYGWRDSPFVDRRMLFTIESQPMLRSSGGLPLSPPPKLQLPLHASSFFSPERRVQWQMVFHGDVFATHRRMCQPVADIFNVIQCLLTGLVTLVHEENLRHHYAMTLRDWCRNLVEHWDEAVEEVGLPTAKVWGLYMAGSRVGFETNVVQLHQVLAVKLDDKGGDGGLPLRPWWTP